MHSPEHDFHKLNHKSVQEKFGNIESALPFRQYVAFKVHKTITFYTIQRLPFECTKNDHILAIAVAIPKLLASICIAGEGGKCRQLIHTKVSNFNMIPC